MKRGADYVSAKFFNPAIFETETHRAGQSATVLRNLHVGAKDPI